MDEMKKIDCEGVGDNDGFFEIGQEPSNSALSARLGLPLDEEKDPDKLRDMAVKLWKMLDDIDTASDIAKSNDGFYRRMVEAVQKRRHQIITSDGYGLFLPEEKQP